MATRAACTAAVLGVLVLGPSAAYAQAPVPSAPASGDSVQIHRDEWGVPHIYATTETAGFYGLGYAQAEDQLDYVLRTILAARGELAAVIGRDAALGVTLAGAPADPVASDFEARRWRHVEEARRGFERHLSPELRRAYEAWAAGLRRYMADHPDEVPEWAPDVQPWDPVVVGRALLWLAYQAGAGLQECQRGGAPLAARLTESLEDAAAFASNEWVVAPWRTAEGATIVLSDPHGPIDGSFVYEFRMHAGDLHSAGFSVGPMLLLVHNRDVSWGMTTGAPDVADCYEVEVDPSDPHRYRYDGEWREMETREVVIEVKGEAPVRGVVEYTNHNGVLSPVVARADGRVWVVSTSYMHRAGYFDEEVWRLNHARSVADVKAAMQLLGMFPQNLMFGDRAGNTYYVRAGRTPIRPPGRDWSRPVPGNTSATAWRGIHPLEDLVQLENPAAGYMQNTNVAPDRMLEASPVTADRYPDYIFNDVPGRTNTRGLRAVEVLSRSWHFTTSDAIELALDEKWYGVERWQSMLQRALTLRADDMREAPTPVRQLARQLLRFDGYARATSVEALGFYHWQEALARRLDAADYRRVGEVLRDGAPVPTDLADALVRGLSDAAATLYARHGGPGARLGDEFRIAVGGLSWPLGGASILPRQMCRAAVDWGSLCMVTLRANTFSDPDSLGRRRAFMGSRLLRVTIFSDPLRSYTLHNYGQSGRPGSPHRADQARLSSQRRLKPSRFEPGDLRGHVVSTTTLEVRVP